MPTTTAIAAPRPWRPPTPASPVPRHAEQQQRQRDGRQPAAAIEKHRRDGDQRAARADDQSANQQKHVFGHDHRQKIRSACSRARAAAPALAAVRAHSEGGSPRARASQHQPQPAKHLKRREVSIFNAVKARETFRTWTRHRRQNPSIAIRAARSPQLFAGEAHRPERSDSPPTRGTAHERLLGHQQLALEDAVGQRGNEAQPDGPL